MVKHYDNTITNKEKTRSPIELMLKEMYKRTILLNFHTLNGRISAMMIDSGIHVEFCDELYPECTVLQLLIVTI
jgi:hypothetical protein